MDEKPRYLFPFILSLGLHIALFLAVFYTVTFTAFKPKQQLVSQPVKIVEAVTVDQQMLQKEIIAIKNAKQKQRQSEAARVKRLAAEAKAAERKKLQAKKQLSDLQKKRKNEEQQRQTKLKELQAKQLQENKKLSQLKEQRQSEEKRQEKIAADKLLEQQLAEEEQLLADAKNQQLQNEIAKYTALIQQAVGRNWLVPTGTDKKLSCRFLIRVAPGGAVLSVKLLKSSGDVALDRSAEKAVYKASPLPVPNDQALFKEFREIRLLVKPEGYLTTTS